MEFRKAFQSLSKNKLEFEVWSEFVYLMACEIAERADSPVKRLFDKREHILKTLNDEQKQLYMDMIGEAEQELKEKPYQDWFGFKYMELGIADKKSKAQLFTPYELSYLTAKFSFAGYEKELAQNGFITIQDGCVGAGSLLIAMTEVAREKGIDDSQLWMLAGDISELALLQAYIQLSLLGVAGIFELGDSLCESYEYALFTPKAREGVWVRRFINKELPFYPVTNNDVEMNYFKEKEYANCRNTD